MGPYCGTRTGYIYGCRCELCSECEKKYKKNYFERKRNNGFIQKKRKKRRWTLKNENGVWVARLKGRIISKATLDQIVEAMIREPKFARSLHRLDEEETNE